MQLHRWLVVASLAALACNVETGGAVPAELTLEPAPQPVDLVWVTGGGAAPEPAIVDGLTALLAEDGVDLRVVVLGGTHPFDGPGFADALRDDAAVHVVLAGPTLDDDAVELDERIAWAVGGPYVLHVMDAQRSAAWNEIAAWTGGLEGVGPHEDRVGAVALGVADAAPLPCTFEVPAEVADASVHPDDWLVSRASGSLREAVPNVDDASGCVGAGGWYPGEAGTMHLCASSCALSASEPDTRFVVDAITPR